MADRRQWLALAAGSIVLPLLAACQPAQSAQPTRLAQAAEQTPNVIAATGGGAAAQRMNTLGPEGQALASRIGQWNVTETVWEKPGAPPVTTTGLVADRQMVGFFLQEMLHPAGAGAGQFTKRIDYLGFDRIEGRWDYMSLETRVPVGLMSAWSFDRGDPDQITVRFLPFSIAGNGDQVTGQTLRMEQVIKRDGPNHEVKDQYFVLADGLGTKWLAHRYDYVRRS